jgi:hypothetical protein
VFAAKKVSEHRGGITMIYEGGMMPCRKQNDPTPGQLTDDVEPDESNQSGRVDATTTHLALVDPAVAHFRALNAKHKVLVFVDGTDSFVPHVGHCVLGQHLGNDRVMAQPSYLRKRDRKQSIKGKRFV